MRGRGRFCGLSAVQLRCWGHNNWGQLGNGTTTNSATPVAVPGRWREVSVGGGFACALEAGVAPTQAYCWGLVGATTTNYGQLGTGAGAASADPIPVRGNVKFKMISAGYWHTCALAIDGTAYCWGLNAGRFLGTENTAANVVEPSPVVGGFKFTTISAGLQMTCGITTVGSAVCWGPNDLGSLGNGSLTGSVTTPTAVVSNPGFVSIYVPRVNHTGGPTCALTAAGRAYCWGTNFSGHLGTTQPLQVCQTGVPVCTGTPTPVEGGYVFTGLSVAQDHVCGSTVDHLVVCWGENLLGQLGDGTRTPSNVPVRVVGGFVTP